MTVRELKNTLDNFDDDMILDENRLLELFYGEFESDVQKIIKEYEFHRQDFLYPVENLIKHEDLTELKKSGIYCKLFTQTIYNKYKIIEKQRSVYYISGNPISDIQISTHQQVYPEDF